jgi:hypothetical protein
MVDREAGRTWPYRGKVPLRTWQHGAIGAQARRIMVQATPFLGGGDYGLFASPTGRTRA